MVEPTAYQGIFRHGATLGWVLKYEREVGTFVFHPQHDHWHSKAFAGYQLHEIAARGGVGEVVREADDKISFCVIDSVAVNTSLAHAVATPGYATRCTQNAIQRTGPPGSPRPLTHSTRSTKRRNSTTQSTDDPDHR